MAVAAVIKTQPLVAVESVVFTRGVAERFDFHHSECITVAAVLCEHCCIQLHGQLCFLVCFLVNLCVRHSQSRSF